MGNLCTRPDKNQPIIPSQYFFCEYCKGQVSKSSLSCHKLCETHEVESFYKDFCIKCNNNLSEAEKDTIRLRYVKKCGVCRRDEYLTKPAKCGCLICLDCFERFKTEKKTKCPLCRSDLEEVKNMNYLCNICQIYFPREEMRTLDCDHYFSPDCIKFYILDKMNTCRNEIISGVMCLNSPECKQKIDPHIIESLLDPEDFKKYVKICIRDLIECPQCSEAFTSLHQRVTCYKCGFFFCNGCKKNAINCNCEKVYEGFMDEIMCCPGCHNPYGKGLGCFHVKCTNFDCQTDFCFECSAFREPTMKHGNHYHRPNCKFYEIFDRDKDYFIKDCPKCAEKGSLCDRPVTLKRKGRFEVGEI